MHKISQAGLEALKGFEGCKLTAYLDSVGIPTIGYGHIVGVKMGQKISQRQAEEMLLNDLVKYESAVNKRVLVPLTQSQYDALVCFTFNLGVGALAGSTLLKKLNALDYVGAAHQFLRWNKIKKGRGYVVSKGLTNRRQAEHKMFYKDIAKKEKVKAVKKPAEKPTKKATKKK